MKATWEDVLNRFKIGKCYHNANLENVKRINPEIYQKGKNWLGFSIKKSLYIHGNAGSGKSYFALALLRALVEHGMHRADILYRPSDELDDELLMAIEDKNEKYALEKYCEVKYLIIDDLGVERVNDRVIKQYYRIIDSRLNNLLTTIFTSNIPLANIGKNLGDRIGSRMEITEEIHFPQRDLRKEIYH